MANLPEASRGEARNKAAATAGLEPRTAEKGLAILNRAESGDKKARELWFIPGDCDLF
jgi:hypothetical protein